MKTIVSDKLVVRVSKFPPAICDRHLAAIFGISLRELFKACAKHGDALQEHVFEVEEEDDSDELRSILVDRKLMPASVGSWKRVPVLFTRHAVAILGAEIATPDQVLQVLTCFAAVQYGKTFTEADAEDLVHENTTDRKFEALVKRVSERVLNTVIPSVERTFKRLWENVETNIDVTIDDGVRDTFTEIATKLVQEALKTQVPKEYPTPSRPVEPPLHRMIADRFNAGLVSVFGVDHKVSNEERSSLWHRIDREFRRRHGIELRIRRENRKKKKVPTPAGFSRWSRVAVAHEAGLVQELYDVVCEVLPLKSDVRES